MAKDAIIFDMDGVLIDSGSVHRDSWVRLAEELGAQVTSEQFSATFGRQNRDIVPMLFGEDLSDNRVAELSDRKEVLYRELARGKIRAVDGAAELVRACQQAGLRLAIGSSAPPLNIELALDELGIAECFEAIVDESAVSRGKPDPQVFLLAAERLGLHPAACVVIEDAPAGIEAALSGGMTVVGLTSHHPADRLARADLVVDSLTDLSPESLRAL